MNDDKYLIKRNGVYYIRVQNPPPEWGFKKEFKHTLRTGNIKIARELRNKYLLPLLAESSAVSMARTLLDSINRNEESIRDKLEDFGYVLGDPKKSSVTIREIFDKFINDTFSRSPFPNCSKSVQVIINRSR